MNSKTTIDKIFEGDDDEAKSLVNSIRGDLFDPKSMAYNLARKHLHSRGSSPNDGYIRTYHYASGSCWVSLGPDYNTRPYFQVFFKHQGDTYWITIYSHRVDNSAVARMKVVLPFLSNYPTDKHGPALYWALMKMLHE